MNRDIYKDIQRVVKELNNKYNCNNCLYVDKCNDGEYCYIDYFDKYSNNKTNRVKKGYEYIKDIKL